MEDSFGKWNGMVNGMVSGMVKWNGNYPNPK
jgi:uncharacterized membrane protein YagU involved in acid resistance